MPRNEFTTKRYQQDPAPKTRETVSTDLNAYNKDSQAATGEVLDEFKWYNAKASKGGNLRDRPKAKTTGRRGSKRRSREGSDSGQGDNDGSVGQAIVVWEG